MVGVPLVTTWHTYKSTHRLKGMFVQPTSNQFKLICNHSIHTFKAMSDALVGQFLARPPFLKINTKFYFTKSKSTRVIFVVQVVIL